MPLGGAAGRPKPLSPVATVSSRGSSTARLTAAAASYDGGALSYQWYSNTTASTEGATAIEGATAAAYQPNVSELGTSYYYVVASCPELESITSSVIAVTVTEEAAPQSITVVCDHPYTVPNDWVKALGGVSYVAKIGDTLTLKAVDENGNVVDGDGMLYIYTTVNDYEPDYWRNVNMYHIPASIPSPIPATVTFRSLRCTIPTSSPRKRPSR